MFTQFIQSETISNKIRSGCCQRTMSILKHMKIGTTLGRSLYELPVVSLRYIDSLIINNRNYSVTDAGTTNPCCFNKSSVLANCASLEASTLWAFWIDSSASTSFLAMSSASWRLVRRRARVIEWNWLIKLTASSLASRRRLDDVKWVADDPELPCCAIMTSQQPVSSASRSAYNISLILISSS